MRTYEINSYFDERRRLYTSCVRQNLTWFQYARDANMDSTKRMSASMMSGGTTQHLQGLVTRKTPSDEPKTHAQYFNHVADVVRANDDLTALRTYNLKRRRQVAYQGYEAVLNRKKRSAVKPTTNGSAASVLLARLPVANTNASVAAAAAALAAQASAAYISPFQAATAAAAPSRPAPVAKSPKPILAAPAPAAPQAIAPAPVSAPTPAPIAVAPVAKPQSAATVPPPVIAHVHARAQQQQHQQQQQRKQQQPLQQQKQQQLLQQQQQQLQKQQQQHATQQNHQPAPVQAAPVVPKRSDFVVGTSVLIRHTADLVACGARNLAGKTGRIVSAPQLYGQELYSVYIDEHETVFQVPFNALTLIRQSTAMHHQQQQQAMMKANGATLIPGMIAPSSAPMGTHNNNPAALRPSPTLEQIKMEHSVQLHRLMQQQYREIQVLQQRYAECRLVNPAALTSIQNELSKLRLVHLSQVQTLKSKQALDLLGK
ncbi:hypothetical protein FI667_g15134, partial [Globisporangium splendens]